MLSVLRFLMDNIYSKRVRLDDNFEELSVSVGGVVTAVDGGSCVISDGGSWIVSKIKVASVMYDAGKRVQESCSKRDFYYSIVKKGSNYVHSLPDVKPFFNVRELGEVPAIIMRLMEFRTALDLVGSLPRGSILLIDGLLEAETPEQEAVIRELEFKSKSFGINVLGVAKTFRHAIEGQSVIGALIRDKPDKKWCYKPVKGSDYFVVKLHERARYAYAISAFKHTDMSVVLPVLVFYSRDPGLIGYPYPLLRVDADARISGHEKRLEENKLRINCKKEKMDFVEYDTRSTSMHSIMDSQKYR